MQITLNGEQREVPDGCTVAQLLQLLELPATRAAVEVDRKLVRRAEHAAFVIPPGAQVEVVTLVGGG
ncbi:MAG: sulfur carrier protein ThiS [Planctomycetota bacterium]|nr:sulfur carrier protein ThiS [Planctomycetota bacterium]